MKIAWVIDSSCAISHEFAAAHNVHVIPLQVAIDERRYDDMVDINEAEFYEMLDGHTVPRSSQPPIGSFIKLYRSLQNEGYNRIISIHLSESLSGTVATARLAAKEVDIPVEVINTGLVAKPMVYILQEGLRLYETTQSTFEDIVAAMSTIRDYAVGYFIVNDLAYLHRGGRLSATSALMGSLLQIKPILQFKYQVFDVISKVRTARKAKEFLFNLLENDVKQRGVREISIVHAHHLQEAETWLRQVRERFPRIPIDISTLGTAVGAHSGPHAIGMAWLRERCEPQTQ